MYKRQIVPIIAPFALINMIRKDKRGIADFLGRTYCMEEADFQFKLESDYNQSLPVPLHFYPEHLFNIDEQKQSA